MESKADAAANSMRSEEFDPQSTLVQDDPSQTLTLELAGFKKENLKILLNSSGNNIEITGEGYLDGNRRRWFRKVVNLPKSCNEKEIRAKFRDGILYLTFPTIAATSQSTEKQAAASAETQATAAKSSGNQQKTSTLPGQVKEKLAAAKEAAASGTGKLQEKLISKKTQVDEEKEKVGEAASGAGKLKEKVSSITDKIGQKKAATMETAEATAEKWKEKMAYKKDELAGGIGKWKTPLANVVAAAVMLVGIALYIYYKFKSPVEEINQKLNYSGNIKI